MKRPPLYAAHRVQQTLTDFRNGPRLLAGMARHRMTGNPAELVYTLRDGTRITCPNVPGARLPIYEVILDDTYRLPWFTRGLGDAPVVLDVGGHIGSFSLAITRLHPKARIEAFEASPSTAAYFERNIAANGVDDRVHCHQVAVTAEAGTVQFIDNGAGSIHNGIISPETATPITVPGISMAEAFARPRTQVDLVKMDAEGAEYDMVLGSSPEDWAGVRRVVMEYHDIPGRSWAELENFFAKTDLKLVERKPSTEHLGLAWLSREPV